MSLVEHRYACDGCTVSAHATKKAVIRLAARMGAHHHKSWPLRAIRQRRSSAPWQTETDVLAAMAHAWSVTMVAVVFLYGSLALEPMWDRAIFLKALRQALITDPELLQPAFEVALDAAASRVEGADGS